MAQVTFVSLVPKESTQKLRDVLATADTAELSWREERHRGASEFYFTGPSTMVREIHAFVTVWLANQKLMHSARSAPSRRPLFRFGR